MLLRSIVVLCTVSISSFSAGAEFMAGAARIDITPPVGLPMWGYGDRHDKPNEGVLDPLYADAVVLAVGDARLGIVGLDLGRAPTRKSFESIRKRIQETSKISHLFLVGSHTHHGPVLEIAEYSPPTTAYTRQLEDMLVEVLAAAAGNLKVAKIATAKATVDMNRNRHSKLPNPPVDRELIVTRLVDDKDAPIATLVNFTAHPTSLPSKLMKYSADYPSTLKSMVREALGGECVFLQGAAGDISTDRRGDDYKAFGKRVGAKAVEIAQSIAPLAPARPSIVAREERFRFEPLRMNLQNPLLRKVYAQWMFRDLVEAYAKEYEQGSQPILTVALVNEQLGIVGASGEFFCNHSLRLKDRARLPALMFLGYCNDYHQYFPTIEAVSEGGYGADAQVSPVPIGAGETIMNRALFHLYDLRGKFKSMLRIVN